MIDVKKIEQEADEILVKKERLSKLVDKEKQLVKKKESILSLYLAGVRLDDFNEYHRMVASSIETYVTKKFKEYAELPSQEKIERIEMLTGCFDGFIKLYDVLADLPRKLNRLNEAYTRTVWNPYTMTDMEERMKERVYKAFEAYLFPYYLDEITASIDCEVIANKTGIFDLIYNRMLALRDQDTKDLEKELRRVTSSERILEVLNIQLNTIE